MAGGLEKRFVSRSWLSAQTCPDSMADVVESLEVGCASPPKAVGAFRFFLNLGRVEGFGLEGNGRRARRDPG